MCSPSSIISALGFNPHFPLVCPLPSFRAVQLPLLCTVVLVSTPSCSLLELLWARKSWTPSVQRATVKSLFSPVEIIPCDSLNLSALQVILEVAIWDNLNGKTEAGEAAWLIIWAEGQKSLSSAVKGKGKE